MTSKKSHYSFYFSLAVFGVSVVIILLLLLRLDIIYIPRLMPSTTKYVRSIPATPTPTGIIQQQIKKSISYTVPSKWKENMQKEQDSNSVIFTTLDYKYLHNGAIMSINTNNKNNYKSLRENLILRTLQTQTPGYIKPEQLQFTTMNGYDVADYPECWEGCNFTYDIISKNNVIYEVVYGCFTNESCGDSDDIKNTEYFSDFLSLVNSIDIK